MREEPEFLAAANASIAVPFMNMGNKAETAGLRVGTDGLCGEEC